MDMAKHKEKHNIVPLGAVEGYTKPMPLNKQFHEGEFLKVKSKNVTSEGASIRTEFVEYSGVVDYVTDRVVCIIVYGGRRRTFNDVDLYTGDVEILERS